MAMQANESSHWEICTACSHTSNAAAHTTSSQTADWENESCSTCAYVLRSADKHVHTYETVSADENTHWGVCACGEEMAIEVHMWDFGTDTCSICGTKNTPVNEVSQNFLIAFFRNLFKI